MADPRKAEENSFKAALCESTSDFYTSVGRDAIGRALGQYLLAVRITPTELLHSNRHQRALSDAGTNLMQGVQKASIAQVKGTQIPVSERIRRLFELTDAIYKTTLQRLETDPPRPIDKSDLPDLLAYRSEESESDRAFRISACLTETLAGKKTWVEKVDTLLDLGREVGKLVAFAPFDSIVAEIMRSPAACKDIIGESALGRDEVDRLLAMYLAEIDPRTAPDKPPSAKAFYRMAAEGHMPETREVMLRHMVRVLESGGKLTRESLSGELAYLHALHARLDRSAGYIGGEDCLEAIQEREARLISDETIDLVMGARTGVAERMLLALRLRAKVISDKAKTYLERYVASVISQPDFVRALDDVAGGPPAQLKLLADIHRETANESLPFRFRDRIRQTTEALQADIIERSKFFAILEKRAGSSAEKALSFIDLIVDGILVGKANVDAARKQAIGYVKQGDFLESYLAADTNGDRKTRLQDLERRLRLAGLG